VSALDVAGVRVTELSLHLPSLEEVFFTLTGRTMTDDEEDAAA
jgi:oleandomycin transport system ATP-binding protein